MGSSSGRRSRRAASGAIRWIAMPSAPSQPRSLNEFQPVIPSIVLMGNLLVDDVVLADGTTRMGQPGGALLYGALGATLWESRPGLVSILGDDYPSHVLEKLEQRGVDLAGVHMLGGSGVR